MALRATFSIYTTSIGCRSFQVLAITSDALAGSRGEWSAVVYPGSSGLHPSDTRATKNAPLPGCSPRVGEVSEKRLKRIGGDAKGQSPLPSVVYLQQQSISTFETNVREWHFVQHSHEAPCRFGQGAVMKQGFVRYRMLSSSQAEMWSMPSFVGSLKSSKLTTYFSKLSSIDKRERYSRSMVSLSVNCRVTWK